MSFEPKPFGKYFLVEKIAVGGMAEIYKAKTFGVDGFEKLLAIKRILSHYSADKEFISMLTDEAKLVVRLSHTNIVQIYDLGKVGEDYYISMEYIDGLNLREVINRGKELDKKIPLPICLYITSEMCKGLDYAHSKRDDQGQPLGIVHRDISPQNILISFEGETKIVDFGIAKAALNVSHTTAGILKGKVTYMSPEQALGKPIDARTDIFSAGILLYEMITGERLFTGESQMEVLRKIREVPITEAMLAEKIPAEAIPIVSKALAFNLKDRYQTAGDFQIELTKKLYSTFPDFSPRHLAALIQDWFSQELKVRKKQAQEEASVAAHTRSVLINENGDESALEDNDDDESPGVIHDTTKPEDSIRPHHLKHGHDENLPFPTKPKSPSKGKGILITGALLLIIAGVFYLTRGKDPVAEPTPPPPSHEETVLGLVEIDSTPAGAAIILNGEPTGQSTPATLEKIKTGEAHSLRLELPNHRPWEKDFTVENEEPLIIEAQLESVPLGSVEVTSEPNGAKIIFNGEDSGEKTPFSFSKLELGKTHMIRIEKDGYIPFEQTITLSDVEPIAIQTTLEKLKELGSLRITSIPAGAAIYVNDTDTGLVTPATIGELETQKSYDIILQLSSYEIEKKIVPLGKEKVKDVTVTLRPLKEAKMATLQVKANVPTAILILDGRPVKSPSGSFEVKPGSHVLEISADGYESLRREVAVTAGQTQTLSLNLVAKAPPPVEPQKPEATLATVDVTSLPRGAQVFVDGVMKGMTPLKLKIPAGSHRVAVQKKDYKPYRQRLTLGDGETKAVIASLEMIPPVTELPEPQKPVPLPPETKDRISASADGFGDVRLDSTPRGAAVLFNGKKAGITPLVIPNVSFSGSHTVIFTMPGFKSLTKTFTLSRKYVEITAPLQKE